MLINWSMICAKSALPWIKALFPEELEVSPYWKDPACLELHCSYASETLSESGLTELCLSLHGAGSVHVNRQTSGIEYACYASLEEIKNDGKTFVVCFVDMKENEL